MGSLAYWLTTAVAFAVSVICSVAEGALLSYSPSRLEDRLKDPKRRALVQGYLERFDRLIFTAIVLNAMSDVALVVACTLGFYRGVVSESPLPALYALLTSLTVVIVGAEVVPRAFAAHFAEALLPKVLPLIDLADRLTAPIIAPLRWLHGAVDRALGGDRDTDERRAEVIVDEIRSAALEGSREGVLDPDASEMIEAVIDFKDVEVREIMTPRTSMASIEVSTPVQEAVKIAVEQGHSRIPVYEGTRDRIVGVLYAKDLLVAWGRAGGMPKDLTLRGLMRKPYFVPETKVIGDLLRELRARKVHIAIVLDEYGGTAGLVTIEDLIEQLVGEIEDEYDEGTADRPPLQWLDERTAEVDAKLHIHEVNQKLGIELPEGGDYETLGGFLFFSLGKIPKKGEKVSTAEADLIVADGDERRINRVRIQLRRPRPAGTPEPAKAAP